MDVEGLRFARDVFAVLAIGLVLLWVYETVAPAAARWLAKRRQQRILRTVLPPPARVAVNRRQRPTWRREWRA